MMAKRAILVILLLALCGGCVPLANQYAPFPEQRDQAPAPGMARLYMIRGYIFYIGSGGGNQVLDNGRMVGDLGNGSYLCWERPAGEAVIDLYGCFGPCGKQLGSPMSKVELAVESGMTYYLYMDALSYQPKSIPHAEAQKYLAEYPKPQMKAWPEAPQMKAGRSAEPAPPAASVPPASEVTSQPPRPQPGKSVSY